MTACVNKKHTRRVALAISASLVGALSLGAAAPAAAFATEGIEAQVVESNDAFGRGSVQFNSTDVVNGVYRYQANAEGRPLDIVVQQVNVLGAGGEVVAGNDDYQVEFYRADSDGEPTGSALANVSEPGNYVAVVTAVDGFYKGSVATGLFSVKPVNFGTMSYFEEHEGNPLQNDTTLTYNGSSLEVGIKSSDVTLVEGVDYSVKILPEGQDNVESAQSVDVVNAGDYVAYITGMGQYAGEDAEVQFKVWPFNFSNITSANGGVFEVADVIGSNTKPAHPSRVGYRDQADGGSWVWLNPELVDLAFVSGNAGEATGSDLFDKIGAYTFSASYDTNNKNLVNTSGAAGVLPNVIVNKVAREASWSYGNSALESSYLIDKSQDESFDVSKIVAKDGKTALANGTQYNVEVYDQANNRADTELGRLDPGVYTVVARTYPAQTSWGVGGTKVVTVTVVEGVIDADASVIVMDNATGKAVTAVNKTYDGTQLWPSGLTVTAYDEDDNAIADNGSIGGLTVTYYDADGKPVTYIEDAGEYTVKITSTKYQLNGTTEIPVTINKVDLSAIKVAALEDWYGAAYLPMLWDAASSSYEPYTWAELDLRYDTHVDAEKGDPATDDKGWDALSSAPDNFQSDTYLTAEKWDEAKGEWVEVEYADRCATAGRYRITLLGTKQLSRNYQFANDDYTTSVEFVVAAKSDLKFPDVKPGEWWFSFVSDAERLSYMGGYSGQGIFGPADGLTRAQAAIVLYNMAGGDKVYPGEDFNYSETDGYVTGFGDVDGNAYYAKAIAWAKATGVVEGYKDGSGNFGPDDPVTREQFAQMLANYAELLGDNVAAADADLSKYSDAGSIDSWALEAMEWAVSEGVMGGNVTLNPTDGVNRAEVAKMVVTYQPNGALTSPTK